KIEEYNKTNRNFEFYWFPYTKTVQLKFVNETQEKIQDKGFWKSMNDVVLENGIFYLISMVARFIPSLSKQISKLTALGVAKGQYVNYSNKIFSTQRWVRFYEMEYNVPAKHFVAVFKEIEACIKENKFEVHFPIEGRFVKADNIMISPAHQRESSYIAVHMFHGMKYKAYFEALEKIFKKYKGRPHYGKMHTLRAKDFESLYPKWDEFKKIRNESDPNQVFVNPYLKEVFGLEAMVETMDSEMANKSMEKRGS
ncbi:D-arabinono-1,4-lactone oxidase, partial [Xanthovirga aplysinae]|uniref:D-arabinono-1,4-lactone oxidase n=1 Tax=Xanthovirga aplysinae TaxID=2529853 RepID=UPI0024846F93